MEITPLNNKSYKYRMNLDNYDSIYEAVDELCIRERYVFDNLVRRNNETQDNCPTTENMIVSWLEGKQCGAIEEILDNYLNEDHPAPYKPIDPKVRRMKELTELMAATYARKNADYGDSFGKSVQRYGIIAALTRMSDKWNRLENLILSKEDNKVKDESVLDTLLDLATYAVMTYMEMERQ